MGLLARREHSRPDLERKLAARGFAEPAVQAALDHLESTGALAADRFTESFIRSRVAKGQGPVKIRADLVSHGIDGAAAAELLRNAGIDWAEAAAIVRRKRFGPEPPQDYADRARQARFLEYRGFGGAEIRAALGGHSID